MSALEALIAATNENVFLREFSFSRGQFSPTPGSELEFADGVVWLDGLLLLFQAKDRTGSGNHDRWFRKKVLGLATKQIRDTLGYLDEFGEVALTNHRGHEFVLSRKAAVSQHCLVVYDTQHTTPLMAATRYHHSTTAGIVHVISMHDYRHMCQVLATPREINDYLVFRELLARRWDGALPSEKALVGQFLAGGMEESPSERFAAMVDRLDERRHEWDMSKITRLFGDRITHQYRAGEKGQAEATLYYRVLAEIASLSRLDLAAFRERFDLSLKAAMNGTFQAPLRMVSESGCGFLFLAVPADQAAVRMRWLLNLVLGSKYEQRLERHVGVVMTPDGGEFQIDWAHVHSPWREDPELEALLRENNPFSPLKVRVTPRYRFEDGTERDDT